MSIPGAARTNAPIGAPDFNTLDEPIKETIVSSFLIIDNIIDEGKWKHLFSCVTFVRLV